MKMSGKRSELGTYPLWPVLYRNGEPVKPRDTVNWNGEEFEVLALWIDRDDDTNVTIFIPGYATEDGITFRGSRNWRVNSRDLERV